MSVIDRISYYQGVRDETPNVELAQELVETSDMKGIAELANHLSDTNKSVQADCLKVLYEVGETKPELIAGYLEDFVELLGSTNNRLVWGSMTALDCIASLRANDLSQHYQTIKDRVSDGSVITRDHGVRVLAKLASAPVSCAADARAYLVDHLATCRPKDVPQHSEGIVPAIPAEEVGPFLEVLQERMPELSRPQVRRVKKVLKNAGGE